MNTTRKPSARRIKLEAELAAVRAEIERLKSLPPPPTAREIMFAAAAAAWKPDGLDDE